MELRMPQQVRRAALIAKTAAILGNGKERSTPLISAALTARLDRVDWREQVVRGQADNVV